MTVASSDYLTTIEHLPAGAVLRMDNVPWNEYEQLLEDLGEAYSVRIFYDQGRMEVMAPSRAHERPKEIIGTLVVVLRDELDIDVESLGSTTYRSELKAKGAEPDDSFYVQNAALVIGRDEDFDLNRDPPPDIVVEADRTNSSLDKFPIFAGLGVREIWLYRKKQVRFYILTGGTYAESPISHAFPFLKAEPLSQFVAQGLAEGGRKAARSFRDWLRAQRLS